jgi:lipopolysaccharide export LptBFGC system permease protein LptF
MHLAFVLLCIAVILLALAMGGKSYNSVIALVLGVVALLLYLLGSHLLR